ncbi:TonB-dependent receptor [Candidatus Desantisbacteria bacterium]|nr:TonB-dependent receptor [Candidatus Desantisbacteria bacterium]
MRKFNCLYVLLLSLFFSTLVYSAEKSKKEAPPIQLPGVTIMGEEKDIFWDTGEKTESIKEDTHDVLKLLPWGIREKEATFSILDIKREPNISGPEEGKKYILGLSLVIGNYYYYMADVIHGGENNNSNYLINYNFMHDRGERKNSTLERHKILLDISHKFAENKFINTYGRYTSNDIEMPGEKDNPLINRSRKLDDMFVLLNWEKKKSGDEYVIIGGFWNGQNLDERNVSADKNNNVGIECNYADIYENPMKFLFRLSNNEYLTTEPAAIYEIGMEMDVNKLIENFNLQLGVLYTNYNYKNIDAQVSPNLELSYKIKKDFTLDAGIKQEFPIPVFGELYNNYYSAINPERLHPEKIWNYQFGFKNRIFYDVNIGMHLYEKDIEDKIVLDEESSGLWMPKNMGELIKIKGVNVDMNLPVSIKTKLKTSYVYADIDVPGSNKKAPLIPVHNLNLMLTFMGKWANFDLTGKYTGERYSDKDITGKKFDMDSYFLWGAKIYRDWGKNFSGFASGENLSEIGYEEVKGYPLHKMRAKIGVTWKF